MDDRVLMVPIRTSKGTFSVRTQRVGDNPGLRVLLLHGGPGATHEYFENFADYLPQADIEFIYYDQLGSFGSDQPSDPDLWEVDRFVDEVEQVRVALDLDASNFVILGHSWGGLLGIEYALRHGEHLKGLVISNMMSSTPAYNEYAHTVLMPQIPPEVLKRIQELEAVEDYGNPDYEALLMQHFYVFHVLRRPPEEWPECVMRSFGHLNGDVYIPMQGPSELGARGKILHWDRFADLHRITVPTLTIGARHDTMDPRHMRAMADELPRGQHLHLPDGSHLAMHDDTDRYFAGLIGFLRGLPAG
jgi:proline iminopeptidase